MGCVFWASGGVIHADFLPHGVKITLLYYTITSSTLICSKKFEIEDLGAVKAHHHTICHCSCTFRKFDISNNNGVGYH
jgi:hypothetical protein